MQVRSYSPGCHLESPHHFATPSHHNLAGSDAAARRVAFFTTSETKRARSTRSGTMLSPGQLSCSTGVRARVVPSVPQAEHPAIGRDERLLLCPAAPSPTLTIDCSSKRWSSFSVQSNLRYRPSSPTRRHTCGAPRLLAVEQRTLEAQSAPLGPLGC